MAIQGTREWQDYQVQATFTPHLARSFGLAARVQGLKRYYALRLHSRWSGTTRPRTRWHNRSREYPVEWELYRSYVLELAVSGPK